MTSYSFSTFFSKTVLLCFIPLISIIFNNCSKNELPLEPEEIENINLTAFNNYEFELNNFHVVMDSAGQLHSGELHNLNQPVDGYNYINVIFRAGLWLGTTVNGVPKANIIWVGSNPSSNYTSKWSNQKRGVYFVDPSILAMPNINWPIKFGIPPEVEDESTLYGDAMCWSVLKSDTVQAVDILSQPIPNIQITQTLFAYLREDLKNIIFIRYSIKNLNGFALNEFYSGFYSDTDLVGAFSTINSTGYDSTRELSYTYSPGETAKTYVTGFTALETLVENGNPIAVSSHRIMRKNNYFDPDFGERGFETAQQVLDALQGLSNSGRPMINQYNGNQTKFAFTGDPVSKTGWLDVAVDVRSLLSLGPFSISPNESKTVTVVWIVEFGNNLSEALKSLKAKVDDIRNEPGLWQF